MNQAEKRAYLIEALLRECAEYEGIEVPTEEALQRKFLRGLVNVRPAVPIAEAWLKVQDAYLQEELARKGVTAVEDLSPLQPGLYVWQGDITTLACDGIVNAANSGLTGCYHPNHGCIDNAIHSFAGVQLRGHCAAMIEMQGHPEPVGKAKITPGFNLPAKYIVHTVGPIVGDALTVADEEALAACYRSCLALAHAKGLKSLAFCCISTGEYHFPNQRAAEIAMATVKDYMKKSISVEKVVFNVFKDEDRAIYEALLG